MTTLSREMALVASCCRWPPSPARDEAVRAAAEDVAWPLVATLMRRHRVQAQARAALAAAGVMLPPALADHLARDAARLVLRNRLLGAESVRLQALFDAQGIASVLVKGAALAEQAYGTQAIKHAKDIDLLVRHTDLAAARGVAEHAGYRLQLPRARLSPHDMAKVLRYGRELTMVHAATGVQLELHWRLTHNPRVLPDLDPGGATETVRWADGDRALRTLPHDDLFAYLCVHGAAHGWIRLKWLADIAAWLSHHPPAEIERLYHAAQQREVGDIAGQALLLAHRLLAMPLPQTLRDTLERNAKVGRLVAAALDLLAGPGAEAEIAERRAGQAKLIRARLMLSRDRADLWAYFRAHAIALEDVLALPLPRQLELLFVLLRGPLWLARRLRARHHT
ncbi:nucleotidyltransferase family protein [Sphingomonas sp. PB4P5]|uniref:nucleotidyltransferase family protein n=1 Tax=Parasphingomonas puruogangriensis TaxID=3096155 RepID=UPI002FCC3611